MITNQVNAFPWEIYDLGQCLSLASGKPEMVLTLLGFWNMAGRV
jgi:hypothetical protein